MIEQDNEFITIKLSVKDSGIGISEDKLEKLFKAFSQVDASTTRQYGGTGLGLAISKKLVELMNGKVGVESEQKMGSTFWFSLPFEKISGLPEHIYSKVLKDQSAIILENDSINLDFFNNIFPAFGLKIKTTQNVEITLSAIKQAEERNAPIDILVLSSNFISADFFQKIAERDIALPKHILIVISEKSSENVDKYFEDKTIQYLTTPLKESQVYHALLQSYGEEIKSAPTEKISEIPRFENAGNIHLLVVDDNLIGQQVTVKILQKMGFQAQGASNGMEALNAMEIIHFDLVFMDCQMPEMDGFQATRKIRQDPTKGDLPIIALTANAMKSDRDACFEAGMNDFMTKPVTAISLEGMLRKFMPNILANKQKS